MADEQLQVEITAIDRASEVMKGISRSTEDFTRTADEAAKTLSRGTVSGREMTMAVSAISDAFGQASPAISTATIHASRFIAAMEGASLSSKITAATVVGLGAAAAAMVAQFMEVEKVNARLAEIDRAVGSLDLGALRSGLSKTSIELETLDRQTSTWTGTFIVGLKNVVALLPGVPNEIEAASMATEKLRAGLEQVLPFYEKLEAAKHAEAMAVLEAANLQAYAQNLLAAGQLPRGAEAWYSDQVTALIQAQAAAAQQAAFQQRQKEFMEASVRGTLDIESDAIVARYSQTIEQIKAKTALQSEILQGNVLKLGQAISDSTGKVMGIELKYVADVGDAWSSLGEMKRTLSDQAIAWTMNEYDKQIAVVDKWEKESIAQVDKKFGYTREAVALEEQIVRDASERKAQITADWTKKVQNALANQVDAFEEAYTLMGQKVTVTTEDMREAAAKGTEDLKREWDKRVQDGINANLYWLGYYRDEQEKELQIAAGTLSGVARLRQDHYNALSVVYAGIAERDNSMWAAMQSGAAKTYGDLGTFWENVSKGFEQTFKDVNRLTSDLFFDVFTGQIDSLGKLFEDFGKRILRTFSDILANAVTRQFLGLFDIGGYTGGAGVGVGGTALTAAQIAALTPGGPAGASSGGGGGLLSPITNLITGLQKVYGLVTGTAESGIAGGLDKMLGVTDLVNALTGSTYPAGTFGGLATTSEATIQAMTTQAAVDELAAMGGTGTAAVAGTGAGATLGATVAPATSEIAATELAAEYGTGAAATAAVGTETGAGAAAGAGAGGLSALAPLGVLAVPGLLDYLMSTFGPDAEKITAERRAQLTSEFNDKFQGDMGLVLDNIVWGLKNGGDITQPVGILVTVTAAQGIRGDALPGILPDLLRSRGYSQADADLVENYLWPSPTPAEQGWQDTSRQFGGPIEAGRAYWVGEKGPERIVPRQAGTVVPNDQVGLRPGGPSGPEGGGPVTIVNNFNFTITIERGCVVGDDIPDEIVRAMEQRLQRIWKSRLPY